LQKLFVEQKLLAGGFKPLNTFSSRGSQTDDGELFLLRFCTSESINRFGLSWITKDGAVHHTILDEKESDCVSDALQASRYDSLRRLICIAPEEDSAEEENRNFAQELPQRYVIVPRELALTTKKHLKLAPNSENMNGYESIDTAFPKEEEEKINLYDDRAQNLFRWSLGNRSLSLSACAQEAQTKKPVVPCSPAPSSVTIKNEEEQMEARPIAYSFPGGQSLFSQSELEEYARLRQHPEWSRLKAQLLSQLPKNILPQY